MDNAEKVAAHVLSIGTIATFLLGILGIHRRGREKVEARLDELDARKADREDVDSMRDEVREFARQNAEQHNVILGHLLGRGHD